MKAILCLICIISLFCDCKEEKQQVRNLSGKDLVASIPPSKEDSALHYIYITFDDGPLRGSEDVDDAIRNEQIKVNVFVVGQHAKSDSLKDFYKLYQTNPYIEIGNHSFSHAHNRYSSFYKSPATVVKDFLRCQTDLQIATKIARQPGRNQWRLPHIRINDVRSGSASADSLFKKGYEVFGWDLEWQHDPKTGVPVQTVDDMVKLIQRKLDEHKTVEPNHLVLLAHDEMFRNGWEESELKQLIDKLKAKGNYRFEHLSNYPQEDSLLRYQTRGKTAANY